MAMLIRGGMLHTMTGQGSFLGDILVQGGRIEAIGKELRLPEDGLTCMLDATGLNVFPGWIDPHIHDGPETDETILRSGDASGVTTGLVWPEEEGACRLLSSAGMGDSRICAIQPGKNTDRQLHECFLSNAQKGFRVACEIRSEQECRRVLSVVHSTRVKAILVHISGCEALPEVIALSGCEVVIGVNPSRSSNPWTMACRLDALGVRTALTCDHPEAKLRHLPICAALCVREGMSRDRALHLISAVPAGMLNLTGAGKIAVGGQADLSIYDGDPLLLATSHVMTIAGGKIRH